MSASPHNPRSVPSEWLCPITYECMQDPVIAPDGRTYERRNIEEWIRVHGTSPFTRENLSLESLIPNIVLREIIENGLVIQPLTTVESVSEQDPSKTIYCLIDRSGSMGECIDTPGYERDGFNRLDLVKHAIRTIIHSLTPEYSLGIVSFSQNARMDLEPVVMNGVGKARSTQVMERIVHTSTTNIWDGIRMIMNRHTDGDTPTIILFTDGVSNIDPPRGIVDTLIREMMLTKVTPTIYTIGFGYDIHSAILHQIASHTGGLFGFIPDCTMIGSVFINILAHIMSRNVGEGEGECIPSWPQLVEYLGEFTTDGYSYDMSREYERVEQLLEAHREYPMVCMDIQDESDDKGQIGKAVRNEEWFRRWGLHYLRSLHLAHKNRVCLNFKDVSLQDYATPEFSMAQQTIEDVFVSLPAPIPSNTDVRERIASGTQALTPMSVYYNASSGCFTGDTKICVCAEDGSCGFRPMYEIKPGDVVLTGNAQKSPVRFVVEFINHRSELVRLSNTLTISAFHPVRRYRGIPMGWTPPWEFPCSIMDSNMETCTLYNLVLENGGVIYTPSHECVVFGHGFRTNTIVSHDYFGTNAIVDDIAEENELQGGNGRVIVNTLQEIRDPESGVVVRYVFNP